MSFRPTISIYLNKHIIDCGYYRNWDEGSLMLECCRLARLLDGCRSRRQVAERLGRTGSIEEWEKTETHAFYMSFEDVDEDERRHDSHLVERLCPLSVPASYCSDEELLHELEDASEFPTYIDLTDRCFYWRPAGFIERPGGEPVKSVRDYEDAWQADGGWLRGGRISFDLIDHIEAKLTKDSAA